MAYSYTPEFKQQIEQEKQMSIVPDELQRLYDAQQPPVVETSEPARDATKEAEELYTKETGQPSTPVAEPETQSKLTREQATQLFGTDFTGVHMNPDGTFTPDASAIQRVTPKPDEKKTETPQEKVENETQESINTVNQMFDELKKTRDQAHSRLIQSIEASTQRLIQQAQQVNKSLQGVVTTSGFRSGLARYAPEMQASRIAYEQQEGLRRIQDIESKKNSLIAEAEQAKTEKDFETFFKRMELVKDFNKEKTKALADLEKSTLEKEKALREKAKEVRETQEHEMKKAEALAPVLADYLTDDDEANAALLKQIGQSPTVDVEPLTLLGAIRKFQASQKEKTTTEDIKTLRALNEERKTQGLPPITLSDFRESEFQKDLEKARAQASIREEYRIPTEGERKASEYLVRMEQANPTLIDLEDKIKNMNVLSFETQVRMPAALQSSNMQLYMQAARNFINSVLRRESGAVIAPSEFKEARQQYLPQPGDTPQTLKEKRITRENYMNALKGTAGKAYTPLPSTNKEQRKSLADLAKEASK